jgi:hypothetical protein
MEWYAKSEHLSMDQGPDNIIGNSRQTLNVQ